MDSSKKAIREQIFDHIVDDITHGRINAGEKLLEVELAKKFNVSRTPVREALLQLEKEDYTVHCKNTGTIVKKISRQEVLEIYEILGMLEASVIEQADVYITSNEDLLFLDELNNEMGRLADDKKYVEYMQKNAEFHDYFLNKHGNAILIKINHDLRRRVYRKIAAGLSLPIYIDKYLKSHREITEALKLKNGKEAKKLMLLHLKNAAFALSKEIDNFQS